MTLKNLKQYQPGAMLGEGEDNRVHRVRADVAVNAWFSSLTASERGAVVAAAYRGAHSSPPIPGGQGAGEGTAVQQRPSDATWGRNPARLYPSNVIPENISAYARRLLIDMRRGGVLIQDGEKYRLTIDGEVSVIRGDVVWSLLSKKAIVQPPDAV